MVEDKEKIPLDTRLLTNAIIELNISRRNVSLYPKGHPAVNQSIKKAFDYLNQIFEIRPFITVAFAKDTIVVDEHALEKKNPVFREFALSISRLNVAYITFKKGLTDEELYNFNKLVTSSKDIFCNEKTQELLGKQGIHHIEVGCIDYDSFSFKETTEEQQAEENLWERYVYGLLKGTLGGNEAFEVVSELSPEELAQMINEVPDEELDENSYDRVITTYLKSASDTPFSTEDMQRLLNMINSLRPELRRQFLSSTVRCLDKDRERLKRAVKDISVDTIINMLDAFNKEQLTIPETLKTILEKFSSLNLDLDMLKPVESEDSLMLDDILLSEDMKRVFQEGNYSEFVSEEYKREIESLVKTKGKPLKGKQIEELTKEFSEPAIYKSLCAVMLELSGSSGVEEENLKKYIERLKQQGTILLETGQYEELANIITTLETLKRENPERTELSEALDYFYSDGFIEALMESLRLIGRLFREGAFKLVDCYGNRIIPHLLDALIKEETSSSRKFLIALILYFGREGVEEAVKLLGDSRWFVKRNMLYILSEAGYEESLPYVKPYCRHENSKVRLEAIKCLLKFNDPYGIEALKELFSSDDHEIVHQAIVLSGTYRVKEVVPELLSLLRKKGISGYDILSKSPVIKSLGQIGDPRAIAGFKDIMKLKSVLFKSAVDSIKEEVVRTLRYFPYQEVKEILDIAINSKNQRLSSMAREIKESFEGAKGNE